MANATRERTRVERSARLRWVPIPQMRTSPVAQRELNNARVDRIATSFDPEQIGTPTVSLREGIYYVIDGQHRVEALKAVGWGDQQIQCWCYEGLTEEEEADIFLKLNDVLAVHAFDKFRIGVTAGREVESDIERIVRAQGLCVSRDVVPGAIGAVGTLHRIYRRGGAKVLSRTLRIVRDAYGDPGLEAAVLDGIGLVCQRYNGQLNDVDVITKLAKANGGVNGLLGKAHAIRYRTGNAKAHCVAAACVDILNAGKGGKKLPSWWKAED